MKTIEDPNGMANYSNKTTGFFVVIAKKDNKTVKWMGRCRVEFEWDLKKNSFHNRVGFHRKGGIDFKLIRMFWSKIFRKLGKASSFSIHKCSISDMCIIDLPPFWNDTDTARSLFSLLLRASVCHYQKGDTILKSLKAYPLASKVVPAIEWYLKGNTFPTYDKLTKTDWEGYTGFVAEFEDVTDNELKQKLVSQLP